MLFLLLFVFTVTAKIKISPHFQVILKFMSSCSVKQNHVKSFKISKFSDSDLIPYLNYKFGHLLMPRHLTLAYI